MPPAPQHGRRIAIIDTIDYCATSVHSNQRTHLDGGDDAGSVDWQLHLALLVQRPFNVQSRRVVPLRYLKNTVSTTAYSSHNSHHSSHLTSFIRTECCSAIRHSHGELGREATQFVVAATNRN